MMATKIVLIFAIFITGNYFCQDSAAVQRVNEKYKEFFYTRVMAIDELGEKIILNDANQYNKNDFRLFNTLTEESSPLLKGRKYDFITYHNLLIQNDSIVRFQNIDNGITVDVEGNPAIKILKNNKYILLHFMKNSLLACYSAQGKKVWERSNVDFFDIQENEQYLTYYTGQNLVKINIANQSSHTIEPQEKVVWLKSYNNNTYAFTEQKGGGSLWSVNDKFINVICNKITFPKGYRMSDYSSDYIEMREKRFLILPLMKFETSKIGKDTDPIISYTNRNSMYDFPMNNLGIYDTLENKWLWQPNDNDKIPTQIFLNDKGDFITYDSSEDHVENESNPLREIKLVLNYGAEKYDLGKLRTEYTNYYWDAPSKQFIYFKNAKWWCFHIKSKEVHELLSVSGQKWVSDDKNGLTDLPYEAIASSSEKSEIIITAKYDLFLVNLENHKVRKLTNGEKSNITYRINAPTIPKSNWNNTITNIDLKKEVILKMFNTGNYHSGFATLKTNQLRTVVYEDANYKDLLIKGENKFAISHSYNKPLKVQKLKNSSSQTIFNNAKFIQKQSEGIQMKLFNYSTPTGLHNGILLFPKNYNADKNYPMIVNIYENQTRETLYYTIPNLQSDVGFNYLHYVHQGYFVLLPDLEYEIGNVREKMITSLEECVAESFKQGNIDRNNIAVIGMSYGGYEAALALSCTNIFKTGSVGVMLSDFVSMALSQSKVMSRPNYERMENYQMRMGESLFNNWTNYIKQSPIFYVSKITQPILLWSGLKDDNVSPAQTKAYFLGLKRLSKKAVLLEYPEEGHNISNKAAREDLNIRTWQWMEYFLKNGPLADWMIPIINKAP